MDWPANESDAKLLDGGVRCWQSHFTPQPHPKLTKYYSHMKLNLVAIYRIFLYCSNIIIMIMIYAPIISITRQLMPRYIAFVVLMLLFFLAFTDRLSAVTVQQADKIRLLWGFLRASAFALSLVFVCSVPARMGEGSFVIPWLIIATRIMLADKYIYGPVDNFCMICDRHLNTRACSSVNWCQVVS